MNQLNAKFNLTLGKFTLDAEINLPIHGFTVLFGRSGSGKTTLLRCMAGLERAPEGLLTIGQEVWQNETKGIFLPVSQRKIGYVFQELRLFPHMTVEGNLRYGFKRHTPKNGETLFGQVVEVMDLASLLNRHPNNLSGGEKQRVSLARSLITSPRLLLMDEPLAALDSKLKSEIIPYFQKMQTELGIPIFYVTHSLNEVLQLVDTMFVINQGRIVTSGRVQDVFSHPNIGLHIGKELVGSVIDTTVVRQDREFHLTVLQFKNQTLYVPHRQISPGKKLRIHIRAEDVTLAISPIQDQTSVLNVLPAKVLGTCPSREDNCKIEVRLDVGYPLLAAITRKSLTHLNLQPGQNIFAHIKAIRMANELD